MLLEKTNKWIIKNLNEEYIETKTNFTEDFKKHPVLSGVFFQIAEGEIIKNIHTFILSDPFLESDYKSFNETKYPEIIRFLELFLIIETENRKNFILKVSDLDFEKVTKINWKLIDVFSYNDGIKLEDNFYRDFEINFTKLKNIENNILEVLNLKSTCTLLLSILGKTVHGNNTFIKLNFDEKDKNEIYKTHGRISDEIDKFLNLFEKYINIIEVKDEK